MKSLTNRRDRSEVLSRLANVRPDAQAKWGTMSAHQMVCHLSDSLRAALGEKYISPSTSLFKRTILNPWHFGFRSHGPTDLTHAPKWTSG